MSRIGRLPIPVPSGVDVSIDGRAVTVKGPKGTLTHTVAEPIEVEQADDGTLQVDAARTTSARTAPLHGLTRTLVANMVTGVTDGYTKKLEIVGTGYRVQARGTTSSSRSASATRCSSTPRRASRFTSRRRPGSRCQGIDKQQVGEVAANIRKLRKPDPYKGKGVRYAGRADPPQGRKGW